MKLHLRRILRAILIFFVCVSLVSLMLLMKLQLSLDENPTIDIKRLLRKLELDEPTKSYLKEIILKALKMGVSSSAIELYGTHRVKFIAESVTDERNKTSSLACISEAFVSDCYEDGTMGFASLFIATLDHLRFCHRNNGIPSVRWRNCLGACKPDPNIDSFSFYVEPLNDGIENKATRVLCLGTNIPYYAYLDDKTVSSRREFKPILDFSFRPRTGNDQYSTKHLITKKVRLKMNFIIKKYVRINPQIRAKVEDFYSQFMKGYNVLGVHVRGTDHWQESAKFELPAMMEWVSEASKILQSLGEPKRLFLATDNEETISVFINHFGKEKVIYSNAVRAKGYEDQYPPHKIKDWKGNDAVQIGQQVFMDVLLLAKCDYFLHAESNVASLASYFNPKMKSFFLGELSKGQRVKKKNIQRGLKSAVIDQERNQHSEGIQDDYLIYMNRKESKEAFKEAVLNDMIDFQRQVLCWERNKAVSVCPNMKTGNFLKRSKFEKYLTS